MLQCSALVLNNTGARGVAVHAQPSTALPLHTRVCRFFSLKEGFSRPPLSTQNSPPVKDPTHTISAMGAPSRKWEWRPMVSVPWGRTIWMLHHVNHGGALEVQYPLRSATKGLRAGLRVAAAMWVALKLEGLGFPLPTRPKWHMSTWAPYRSSPRKMPSGNPLSKSTSHWRPTLLPLP